ncbi:MAG: 30S ribosome-binding factor RbfA [Caulobacteraceae bacterium]|jgi:ribosome-binding factor A|nr:30S ribosome-binding factor RbfA [Caulobacteraceae bacterium]MBK8544709.1 30S ribosome-binding factor RbfA [Caulobacteraceae bacterium]MBP6688946.1 30S ribosome-binding factor RbfA [Hyphomonadaceae bacterium]
MKRKSRGGHEGHGPSQRQLRAAEVVRHALVDIVQREELRDADLKGVYVTIGEVRASPDLKHMTAFVSSLGPSDPQLIANGLTRISPFLRGRLARNIALKFTPELHFQPDISYDEARHIDELLASPEVARDLKQDADEEEGER